MADRQYTTSVKIAAFLGVTITDDLSVYILAAQKLIEQITGRIFKVDAAATARDFDGGGGQILAIDDCVQITKVEKGDNFYADSYSTIQSREDAGSADYYDILPANNEAEEVPINRLILRNRFWIVGVKNHRITAKWGWSATAPADICMAATIFASGMYNANKLEGNGNVKSEKIGNYSVSFDNINGASKWNDLETAKSILNSYKKFQL